MEYTVQQLATLAGVSVRTLHYYDEIGLLKPSFIKKNGYRYYQEQEVIRLQQILFFRELAFSLEEITHMMRAPDFNRKEALEDQKKLLELKRQRLDKLIHTIETTITTMEGGEHSMNNDDLFASFDDEELVKNMEEAKKRWGNTQAYQQSMQRVKGWTKADYQKLKEDGKKFTQTLADAMEKDIQSPEVQALIKKHHEGIEYFYACSYEMYRGIAELYISDPRFTAYYDDFRPGLAQWLYTAIQYYCDQYEQQNA